MKRKKPQEVPYYLKSPAEKRKRPRIGLNAPRHNTDDDLDETAEQAETESLSAKRGLAALRGGISCNGHSYAGAQRNLTGGRMKTITIEEYGVNTQYDVYTFGSGEPHITFTAGIHGNEVSGIYVAQRLIGHFIKNPPVKGTVKIIPTVNAAAMRCMQRRSPFGRG